MEDDDLMKGEFLSFEDIPIGSIWMAASGGAFGHVVIGKKPSTKDIIVRAFTGKGWVDEQATARTSDDGDLIDWYKLQYRYYLVYSPTPLNLEKKDG